MNERVTVHHGDCLEVLRTLADASVHSCVTDPPYALVSIVKRFGKPGSKLAKGDVYRRAGRGFMGKAWAYLCRLVTPPSGIVLDPFAGAGSTGMACLREGFRAILIEREAEYVADIHKRTAHVAGADTPLFGGTTLATDGRTDDSCTATSRPTNRADGIETVTK